MIVPIRYTRGAGNAAIYVRLRNSAGQFWDFIGLVWLGVETANCRIFFSERPDSDTLESLYVADIALPPNGPHIAEAVSVTDNTVIGGDTTAIDTTMSSRVSQTSFDTELNLVQASQADANTALSMLLTNVGTLLDIGQGNWQIANNQMIFSNRDGTELMRFALQDKAGQPSETEVFRRVKI